MLEVCRQKVSQTDPGWTATAIHPDYETELCPSVLLAGGIDPLVAVRYQRCRRGRRAILGRPQRGKCRLHLLRIGSAWHVSDLVVVGNRRGFCTSGVRANG